MRAPATLVLETGAGVAIVVEGIYAAQAIRRSLATRLRLSERAAASSCVTIAWICSATIRCDLAAG